MILALRFLVLQSSPGIDIRGLAKPFDFMLTHFAHLLFLPVFICLLIWNSVIRFFSLQQVQVISLLSPDITRSTSTFLKCCIPGFQLRLRCAFMETLDLALLRSLLLYLEIQERHQLESPDLTLLFGGNADNSFTALHFEHDLFMRRIVTSR